MLFVMAGLVPAMHVLTIRCLKDVDARHIRAFTPVFDGLWPGMTNRKAARREGQATLVAVVPEAATSGSVSHITRLRPWRLAA